MDLKKILPLFSYVFHPVFISLYATFFYFVASGMYVYQSQFLLTLIQVGILTTLLPISLYFLFISLGMVKSFTEANLKERKLPIVFQAILFFILIKFSASFNSHPELYYFFLGGFFSALLAFIAVLLQFKASLHMIGISSLATFIYSLCLHLELDFIYSIGFIITMTGFVASSRLYMKSHTSFELLIGSLIGVFTQVVFLHFWL